MLITGATGCGKCFLACALGQSSCDHGYRVLYMNVQKLVARAKVARAEGQSAKFFDTIRRKHLLIIDDFGLVAQLRSSPASSLYLPGLTSSARTPLPTLFSTALFTHHTASKSRVNRCARNGNFITLILTYKAPMTLGGATCSDTGVKIPEISKQFLCHVVLPFLAYKLLFYLPDFQLAPRNKERSPSGSALFQ